MSRMEGMFTAWGRILSGRAPNLSIEITRECPLRCPGCYAYGDDHLGGDVTLREVARLQGPGAGRRRAARSIDEHKPLHLSIVGGEPLVRFRELNTLLPILADARHPHAARHERGARRSRSSGRSLPRLQIVVSIDGLQPEHDERRTPATYDRILKHIAGHQITVHCTVTRQQVQRDGLPRGVRPVLVGATPDIEPDLGQPLHAADRRESPESAAAGRSRAGRRSDLLRAAARAIPKLRDARRA